jgi:hypothetical protein
MAISGHRWTNLSVIGHSQRPLGPPDKAEVSGSSPLRPTRFDWVVPATCRLPPPDLIAELSETDAASATLLASTLPAQATDGRAETCRAELMKPHPSGVAGHSPLSAPSAQVLLYRDGLLRDRDAAIQLAGLRHMLPQKTLRHFQSIADRGACRKTPCSAENRRSEAKKVAGGGL